MATLKVGKNLSLKTHDDVVKVWKPGDVVLYAGGEVIACTAAHVPAVPRGVVIGQLGAGPRPVLNVKSNVSPFNIGKGTGGVVITDLNVITAKSQAAIFDMGDATVVRRCANLGKGLFLQMRGTTSTTCEDCQDSVDPRPDGLADNSRLAVGHRLGITLDVWCSIYSIYGGPDLGTPPPSMSRFSLHRFYGQGKNSSISPGPGDTLHIVRLHANHSVDIVDTILENLAALARTCFTIKEYGHPLTLLRVKTKFADNALGPLAQTSQGDPPNWRELFLDDVSITDCELLGKNWGLDIDPGVRRLTMTRGMLGGSQCGMNVRGGYSGCIPDTFDSAGHLIKKGELLPDPPSGPVRMSSALKLVGVKNGGIAPLVAGMTGLVTIA